MSVEQALIARARSNVVLAHTVEIHGVEAAKGCKPAIADRPVSLEPVFQPLDMVGYQDSRSPVEAWSFERPPPANQLVRLEIWVSPDQPWKWSRSESLLKLLVAARHRMAFEVVGNAAGVASRLLCHRDDMGVIETAFVGQFERCRLVPRSTTGGMSVDWSSVALLDYYPPPPYSHLLTRPKELGRTPYFGLFAALSRICPPAVGVYQIVFQAVCPANNWHHNVQTLTDLEFNVKLLRDPADPRRYAQQSPSNDLPQLAGELESKAHNDKPFFATALRVAVLNGDRLAEAHLRSVDLVVRLFQHGGRQLNALNATDYHACLPQSHVARIVPAAITFRPGFLTNSEELTSLLHIPPPELGETIVATPINRLETLPPDELLQQGTRIGHCDYAGAHLPVCIPHSMRDLHAHVIGRSGTGKSYLLESMILDDIQRGVGVVVIDPHGDLVERVLRFVSREDIERVIYFNPGDPEWIPLWNPLLPIPDQDLGRTAEDLVAAIKSFMDGWGDRLETLLRYVFHGALSVPGTTLLEVLSLFRKGSEAGERFRQAALQAVDNEAARGFWQHDLKSYRPDDFGPPRNKLSKLMISEPVSLMLSQPESAFSFTDVMQRGHILLADLSNVGSQVRNVLGSLVLALMYVTAVTRNLTSVHDRREVQIYCDEAYRFMTDALEDILTETRKYNVAVTLAHQYMRQFTGSKPDALIGAGTTVSFNVITPDAERLTKQMRGLVETEDLIQLEQQQAIARIQNHIVRFRTDDRPDWPETHNREEIIRKSRLRYYRRARDVRSAVRNRMRGPGALATGAQLDLDALNDLDSF